MDPDIALAVLKITSVLITAILGVAGLLANYRDRYGKLTRAGVAVLSGMLISAAVGVITTTIESYNVKTASAQQAARTEALLRELKRSVLPITQLGMSYYLEVPQTFPPVARYVERLEAGLAELMPQLKDVSQVEPVGLSAISFDEHDNVLTVSIKKESSLWPRKEELYLFDDFFTTSLSMLKTPVSASQYRWVHGAADFHASSYTNESFALHWNFDKRTLEISGRAEFEKALWKTNGKITSVADLPGSKIFFSFGSEYANPRGEALPHDAEVANQIVAALQPRAVHLNFGEGRGLWLSKSKFQTERTPRGKIARSVVFPVDDGAFRKFTESPED